MPPIQQDLRRRRNATSRVPTLIVLTSLFIGCTETSTETSIAENGSRADEETVPAEVSLVRFVDHSDAVRFTYRNGEQLNVNSMVESIGGGVALFDYDRDGNLDIAATGGGSFSASRISDTNFRTKPLPNGLFRGHGDWTFDAVATPASIATSPHYSHGLAVGDYNNDGFADVLITGYGGLALWTNMGDGTFVLTQPAGLNDDQWSTSAGWADLNNDGTLDLFVVHYVDWSVENHPICVGTDGVNDVCPPRSFEGLDDSLFFSDGAGGFVRGEGLARGGKGLGVVLGDVDVDGDVDVYVGNDTTLNFLYINDGQGVLDENALLLGVAVDDRGHPDGSMGVDIGDYNNDGLPDIWVANYESEAFALYQNAGAGGFLYATPQTGVGSIGDLFVGFGTVFEDFDSDGDEDIVVTNGHVVQTARQSAIRQQPLYLQNTDGQFDRVTFEDGYFEQSHIGRGLASGDIDNDGDADLVVSHNNDPIAILENATPGAGGRLSVRLVGVRGNRDAIGARLELTTDTATRYRQVTGGGSYLSHSDAMVRFAWPAEERPKMLKIVWPNGETTEMGAVNWTKRPQLTIRQSLNNGL